MTSGSSWPWVADLRRGLAGMEAHAPLPEREGDRTGASAAPPGATGFDAPRPRRAAVLLPFTTHPTRGDDPYVWLIVRHGGMRSHAGQPAFPGGSIDPEDRDATAAALREAQEEIALAPAAVTVLGELPTREVTVSGFRVTPVVGLVDPAAAPHIAAPREVDAILRVPVAELLDPTNRRSAVHPRGYVGPSFLVDPAHMTAVSPTLPVAGPIVVWGFTGAVLDRFLRECGWERPWNRDRTVPVG